MSWKELIPLANGSASLTLRFDSYALNACAISPNRSVTRPISVSKKPPCSSAAPFCST